ncbi:MAG: Rnf-Nqr domain containing protein [bacterium]
MISNDLSLFLIFISACIVNNILLIRFIALCPFFGLANQLEASVGIGMAVIFVMVISSSVTWIFYYYLLEPFNILFLRTAVFILVIATLVQLEEMYIRKMLPALYKSLGIYLPLITTNCAILAAAFLGIDYKLSFVQNLVYSLGVSSGFTLSIVLFATIMERIKAAPIPKYFQGYPIAFITASLMSLAFLGFSRLFGL